MMPTVRDVRVRSTAPPRAYLARFRGFGTGLWRDKSQVTRIWFSKKRDAPNPQLCWGYSAQAALRRKPPADGDVASHGVTSRKKMRKLPRTPRPRAFERAR